MARERGWRIGTFCNGTRWVVGHFWSGYDGVDYFNENGGETSICRMHTGAAWEQDWDSTWRPSYPGCLGVEMTRELAVDFVRRIIDLGLDWVQFLDQNIGCCTFPCFADDHGHPSIPGKWMTERMGLLLNDFGRMADDVHKASGGEREIIFSVEEPVNEFFMPRFQLCDIRVIPPGHNYISSHGAHLLTITKESLHIWYYDMATRNIDEGAKGRTPP